MTAASREADLMACDSRANHATKDDAEMVVLVDRCMAERGYEKQPAK
jgi:hypothetical protein